MVRKGGVGAFVDDLFPPCMVNGLKLASLLIASPTCSKLNIWATPYPIKSPIFHFLSSKRFLF